MPCFAQSARVSRRCRKGVSSIWFTAGTCFALPSSSSRCGTRKLLTPIERARPLLVEALEGAPGFEPFARDGPVNEVEVDVVEPEPLQAGVERASASS